MTRTGIALGIVLALAGCGREAATLPADPIERAATCGAVAAAAARVGQTPDQVARPLPLESQGRILHHALLGGFEGDAFAQDRVAAVVERMPVVGEALGEKAVEELSAPCAAAYPQTATTTITLPENALDAQLSCYTLAAFLGRALGAQGDAYIDQLADYQAMRTKLDPRIGARLTARGDTSAEDQADGRAERLGAAARLGSPTAVMAACLKRYG